MSILSGFLKTIKYRLTDEGYRWQSEMTSSASVVMGDGTDGTDTVEKRFGKMKGITSSLASTSEEYALSAKAGKSLQDSILEILSGLTKPNIDDAVYQARQAKWAKYLSDGKTGYGVSDISILKNYVTTLNNLVNQKPSWQTIKTLCSVVYAERAGWTMLVCASAPISTIPANTWSILANIPAESQCRPKYNIPFTGTFGSYTFIGHVYTNGNIVIYPSFEITTGGNAICFNVSYPNEHEELILDSWSNIILDTI